MTNNMLCSEIGWSEGMDNISFFLQNPEWLSKIYSSVPVCLSFHSPFNTDSSPFQGAEWEREYYICQFIGCEVKPEICFIFIYPITSDLEHVFK